MNPPKLKQKNNVSFAVCPLCRDSADLCESHIIPHHVYHWLKRTSSTGILRLLGAVNRRVQDGFTEKMLCRECEERFSKWEKQFAENVFVPIHETDALTVSYEGWMAKFSVSIVWRVLMLSRKFGMDDYSTHHLSMVDSTLGAWREFLIDDSAIPEFPNIRMLLLDPAIQTSHAGMPEDLNRYFMRAVEIDVCKSPICIFVYAKICRLTLIGFVIMTDTHRRLGAPIRFDNGQLDRRLNQGVTEDVFGYIMERVQHMSEIESTLSSKQKQNIDDTIDSDLQRYLRSETHDALVKDIALNTKNRPTV